jgi:hypothetical protein
LRGPSGVAGSAQRVDERCMIAVLQSTYVYHDDEVGDHRLIDVRYGAGCADYVYEVKRKRIGGGGTRPPPDDLPANGQTDL